MRILIKMSRLNFVRRVVYLTMSIADVLYKTIILKVLLRIMRRKARKVVHGKVQGQRQKDRKVVGILATLLHSLTRIIEQYFRKTSFYAKF